MTLATQETEYNRVFEELAADIGLPENRYQQAENRYKSISNWLIRDGSTVAKFDPIIYMQGSFRLGTAIKPSSDDEAYDIDLVCELNLSKRSVSQKQVKALVGQEIIAYIQANNFEASPEENRRCWTLNYADGAQFHADILPAIPDRESFEKMLEARHLQGVFTDTAIAITDNTRQNYDFIHDDWLPSNPKGYANWFQDRMRTQFDLGRLLLAKAARTTVEQIPDYRVKTPLQKAVQLLKRHRDLMFADDQSDKPISIIITTLAAQAYNNEANLIDALVAIAQGMSQHIETKDGKTWIGNPVNLTENFADKWEEKPHLEQAFKRWLSQLDTDLSNALATGDFQAFGAVQASQEPQKNTGFQPIIDAMTRMLDRFNVPHRQGPRWPVSIQGQVSISGWAERDGYRPWQIYSDQAALLKKCSLRFEARTDISRPYKIYWQVVNTGSEAHTANGLRGDFCDGLIEKGRLVRKESTLYKGMHWIECFVVRQGVCVARSGEFVVNIQ